jgi:putative ABC transport system permease protein
VLNEEARQKISQAPNVLEAFPDIRFVTELRYEDKPHLTVVSGLPFSARDNDAFEGMQGRYFSSDNAPEAILQKRFAEELLGKKSPPGIDKTSVGEIAAPLLGKELVMRYAERVEQAAPAIAAGTSQSNASVAAQDESESAAYSVISRTATLKIVGISDLDPDSMRGMASAKVFVPLGLAETLHVMQASDLRDTTHALSNNPVYARVTVRVANPKDVQPVEDTIKKMGFNTFSIVDATRGMRQFFAVLDLFLGIFGSLALAVASIGIVNTLVMAILERRREIGIMKAIGASDEDVKKLFFAEAGVMGVFGGVMGVVLGWTIGRVINIGANIYLRRQNFPPEQIWSVPLWLVFSAILFAIVVSLISGFYPARRAARLDPVHALRYE